MFNGILTDFLLNPTAGDPSISDSAKDTYYIIRYRQQSWLKSDKLRTEYFHFSYQKQNQLNGSILLYDKYWVTKFQSLKYILK